MPNDALLLDNFNRADATPLSGSWTTINGTTYGSGNYGDVAYGGGQPLSIISSQVTGPVGTAGSARHSTSTFGPHAETWLTIPTQPASSEPLRLGLITTGLVGYDLEYVDNPASTDVFRIYRIVAASAYGSGTYNSGTYGGGSAGFNSTQLGADIFHEVAAGDRLALTIEATDIKFWHKTPAGSWTLITARTDTTHRPTTLSPYIFITGNTARVDDLGGGTIGSSANTEDTRDVRTRGRADSSRTNDTRTIGQASANTTRDIRVRGQLGTLVTRDVRVIGSLPSSNVAFDASVRGQAVSLADRDIRVVGTAPSSNVAFAVEVRGYLPTPQIARPVLDAVPGGWTSEPLYDKLDEPVANDGDVIQSSENPITADITELRLGSVIDPGTSSGHIMRYRYRKNASGGSTINLTVRLMQGTTEIASWTHNNLGDTMLLAEQTLTTGQADSITDYSDLRLRFEAVMS